MLRYVRSATRRLLGVRRDPTYYLPWLTRPGLDCVVLLNNIESRFTSGRDARDIEATVTQLDADGRVVGVERTTLADSIDAREARLTPAGAGYGLVTVEAPTIRSDFYVALIDAETYTATHGRHEFIEHYPPWTRAVLAIAGALLAPLGRTVPAFRRDQYVYHGAASRSHLMLFNLSNVVNRIRIVARRDGVRVGARLIRVPPRGTRLLDVDALAPAVGPLTVEQLQITGNAWFNLYLVGAGARDLEGALSLMHVK
jgi:hypothetical protein